VNQMQKDRPRHAQQRLPVAAYSLQEFNQQALESLTQASDASRGKFLDVKFLRNRRLQSAQHQVRHWFTNVDQWLQGSGAAEEVAVSFFEEEVCTGPHVNKPMSWSHCEFNQHILHVVVFQNNSSLCLLQQGKDGGGTDTLAGEQQPLPLVEEDPSQPKCAISGGFQRCKYPGSMCWLQ
jgi:hypothetical protein